MSDKNIFRLSYPVDREAYVEAIVFQLKLSQQTLFSRIRYYGGSWGLLLFCIWFAFSQESYSTPARLIPLAAAALLTAVTTYFRFGLKRRASNAYEKLEKAGAFEKGYLGTHTLSIDKDTVTLHYGNTNQKTPLANVAQMFTLDNISVLIADSVIFELIPNKVLDQKGNRDALVNAIRSNTSKTQQEAADRKRAAIREESPRVYVTTTSDPERAAQGKAAGYRWFYTTFSAWKGHPTICFVILVYGIFTFATGMQQTIGLLFIILGLYLNRRMLSTFTPLAIQTARRTIAENNTDLGVDFYYTTNKELVTIVCGEELRAEKSDITAKRRSARYLLFYTVDKNMLVIPRSVLSKEQEKQFYELR